MGNCYTGVSDARAAEAERGVLPFACMRADQVRIQNVDLNAKMAEIQAEYDQEFRQLVEK